MELANIYPRVAAWNEKRYARELDKPLLLNLLREEYQEFMDAGSEVDKIDALCDIIYVAFGGVWKADVDDAALDNASDSAHDYIRYLTDGIYIPSVFHMATILDFYAKSEDMISHELVCFICVYSAFGTLLDLGFSYEQAVKAVEIVCDSNDTKKVEKVSSDIKANQDKGEFFKAPEPRLTQLLREVHHDVTH